MFDRLLIVAAHPDDEVLGAGGLLSVLSNRKQSVVRVVFICEGTSCRFSSPDEPESLAAQAYRQSCCIQALQLFNINDIHFINLPCGNLNLIPQLSINKAIEAHLSDFCPTTVLTHYSLDCNNDHRIVSRATDMALRPVPSYSDISLLHFEVQSSTDWNFSAPVFNPNFFIPLSEHNLSQKLSAMSLYDAEYSTPTASRGSQSLTSLAHVRGLQCAHNYAEAYCLIRHNYAF